MQLKHKSQKPFSWSRHVILPILTHMNLQNTVLHCQQSHSVGCVYLDDFFYFSRKGFGQETEGFYLPALIPPSILGEGEYREAGWKTQISPFTNECRTLC